MAQKPYHISIVKVTVTMSPEHVMNRKPWLHSIDQNILDQSWCYNGTLQSDTTYMYSILKNPSVSGILVLFKERRKLYE